MGDEGEKQIEIWKVKRVSTLLLFAALFLLQWLMAGALTTKCRLQLIKALEAARGNGTSMISLIMPPKDQVSPVTAELHIVNNFEDSSSRRELKDFSNTITLLH